MSNKLTLKPVPQEAEDIGPFRTALAEVEKMVKARPTLTPAQLVSNYLAPMMEAAIEEAQEYTDFRIEEAKEELVDELTGGAGVGDEDLTSRAGVVVVKFAALLDTVLVQTGWTDAKGEYTKLCPAEFQKSLDEAKGEVQAWTEDYAAYLQDAAEEDAAGDEGDDGEDDGEDGEGGAAEGEIVPGPGAA